MHIEFRKMFFVFYKTVFDRCYKKIKIDNISISVCLFKKSIRKSILVPGNTCLKIVCFLNNKEINDDDLILAGSKIDIKRSILNRGRKTTPNTQPIVTLVKRTQAVESFQETKKSTGRSAARDTSLVPKGIPRSFLVLDNSKTRYVDYKETVIAKKKYSQLFVEDEFEKMSLVVPRSVPIALQCQLCNDILRNPVTLPCCGMFVCCEQCVCNKVLNDEYEQLICKNNSQCILDSSDNISSNKELATRVHLFLNEKKVF